MQALGSSPPAISQQAALDSLGPDLDHLRTEALKALLPGIAIGVYALVALILTVSMPRLGTLSALGASLGAWVLAATTWSTCVLSYLVLGRGARIASAILVLGLLGTLVGAVRLFPHGTFACGFSLVVVIAGLLLGPRHGLSAAVLSTVVVMSDWAGPHAVPGDILLTALFLIWASVFLSWLTSRPLFDALNWSFSAYQQAQRKTEEARLQRAQLVGLTKNLNEAYYRLETLNHKLHRAREAAEEARQLKAQFAASISHELRTPLNLIIGFSEMMVLAPRTYHGEKLPERYRGDVEAIYRNARHLSDLIDDVLELSQIDANRLGLRMERASLGEIVDEAVVAVAGMFKDKQLALVTHVPGDLPSLFVDRTRIRQVLINLLNNAARFTDEGGVRVAAKRNGREVVVEVTDTGIGIPPDDIPEVFREFYQVRSVGGHLRGGSGLGLAITKRFVELHGGSIWAESHTGVGTTFAFSLPLHDGAAVFPLPIPRPAVPPPPYESGDNRPVVVFGEDPEPLRVLQRHLDGYRVEVAASAEKAYQQALQESAYAAIAICPEEAGRWLQLQGDASSLKDMPLITCSWRTSRNTRGKLGVAEYLVKPVSREQVRSVLRRLGTEVRNLLIVDDDPEMLRLLSQMVSVTSPAYRVQLAGDGASAIAAMRESRPDAVLLDLIMPGISGYSVLEEMRADERLRSIPVVVITAKGLEEEAIVASQLCISKAEGLSVAETVRCVGATLDALLKASQRSSAPAQPEGLTV